MEVHHKKLSRFQIWLFVTTEAVLLVFVLMDRKLSFLVHCLFVTSVKSPKCLTNIQLIVYLVLNNMLY